MPDLVDRTLILEADPSLDERKATRLLQAINGQVRRVAPCLLDADDGTRAEAAQVVFDALQALADAPPPWLESETNGPFASKFRSPASRTVLTRAQEDTLRALCSGAASITPGVSRGSFPDAEPLEDLFARRLPRRPGL